MSRGKSFKVLAKRNGTQVSNIPTASLAGRNKVFTPECVQDGVTAIRDRHPKQIEVSGVIETE